MIETVIVYITDHRFIITPIELSSRVFLSGTSNKSAVNNVIKKRREDKEGGGDVNGNRKEEDEAYSPKPWCAHLGRRRSRMRRTTT